MNGLKIIYALEKRPLLGVFLTTGLMVFNLVLSIGIFLPNLISSNMNIVAIFTLAAICILSTIIMLAALIYFLGIFVGKLIQKLRQKHE